MSEKLTEKQVRDVARLARINCSDEEIGTFTRQLGAIMDYISQLEELDTSNVEPLAHCLPIHNIFREDIIKASLTNEQALNNAPQRDGEFFAIPKVLGDTNA